MEEKLNTLDLQKQTLQAQLAALREEKERTEAEWKARQDWKAKWADKIEKAGIAFIDILADASQDAQAIGINKIDCSILLGDVSKSLNSRRGMSFL